MEVVLSLKLHLCFQVPLQVLTKCSACLLAMDHSFIQWLNRDMGGGSVPQISVTSAHSAIGKVG